MKNTITRVDALNIAINSIPMVIENPAEVVEILTKIRDQIARFRAYDALLRGGDYYRLASDGCVTAWLFVSPERDAALLNVVVTAPESNPRPLHLRLRGLDPGVEYRVERREFFGCVIPPEDSPFDLTGAHRYSGAALMYGGYTLPALFGNVPSVQILFRAEAQFKEAGGIKDA